MNFKLCFIFVTISLSIYAKENSYCKNLKQFKIPKIDLPSTDQKKTFQASKDQCWVYQNGFSKNQKDSPN
jgi:hypothetical protein